MKKSQKIEFYILLGVSICIGLFAFFYIFGYEALDFTNIAWLGGGDRGKDFIAWHFFRQEAWYFPIGDIKNYFYPLGANVGLTDSIPLLAIPFKLFHSYLPTNFQYQGFWLMTCFIIQAVYSALLTSKIKHNLIFKISVVFLLVYSPVFLFRFGHIALCSQWLILGSFYSYFFIKNTRNTIIHQFFLLFASLLIHPYLAFMVFALSTAVILKVWLGKNKFKLKHAVLVFTVFLFFSILIFYLIGYVRWMSVDSLKNYGEGGFGMYSANINALINSQGKSTFIPQLPYLSDQYEGFNYLGLGIIILLLVSGSIWLFNKIKRKDYNIIITSQQLRYYLPIIIVILVMAIFSFSNVVAINEHILLKMGLSEHANYILAPFRSSGRFMWPLHYILILLAVFSIIKLIKNKYITTVIIVIIAFIQLVDIKILWTPNLILREISEITTTKEWEKLYNKVDYVRFFPPFKSSYIFGGDYMPFVYMAANMDKKINTGVLARYDWNGMRQEEEKYIEELKNQTINSDTLYITTLQYKYLFNDLVKNKVASCNFLDGYIYCLKN